MVCTTTPAVESLSKDIWNFEPLLQPGSYSFCKLSVPNRSDICLKKTDNKKETVLRMTYEKSTHSIIEWEKQNSRNTLNV